MTAVVTEMARIVSGARTTFSKDRMDTASHVFVTRQVKKYFKLSFKKLMDTFFVQSLTFFKIK